MTHYINKADVVREIEKLSAYLDSLHEQRIIEKILSIIDTLEVKETNDAYKQGYNDAIDKVCKWLKFNFNMPDDFEAHLKKAMEEQQ